jgi:hypothetical protein
MLFCNGAPKCILVKPVVLTGKSKSLFGEKIPGSAQKVPGSSENREFPRKAALDHQPAIWKGCFLPTRYCDNLS